MTFVGFYRFFNTPQGFVVKLEMLSNFRPMKAASEALQYDEKNM
jgi:hypothetical protein